MISNVFNLEISSASYKFPTFILTHLSFKPKTEKYYTANCIYHFRCDCNSDYIGQNKRKVKIRISEHFKNEPISDHIKYCKNYKSKFKFSKNSVIKMLPLNNYA